MYSEKVMDLFRPRNVGEIEKPAGVGTVGNAKCGVSCESILILMIMV